jgi:maleylpyruvate isomerase
VRIALHWKKVPFTYVPVHLLQDGGQQKRDEYRERNPMAQVPTLEWSENGKVRHLAQSLAILEYLEETHPEPPLLPRDPFLRGRARQIAEIINSGIQPFQNLPVLAAVSSAGGDGAAFAAGFIGRGLQAIETLAKETHGQFCVGDQVTFADVCLIPQLVAARRFSVPLDDKPILLAVEKRCAELPAFIAGHADAQPDKDK